MTNAERICLTITMNLIFCLITIANSIEICTSIWKKDSVSFTRLAVHLQHVKTLFAC